jgi:muramoyltetrapeptide carboxypeptidase
MGSSEKVFRIGLSAPGTRMSPELARQKAGEVAEKPVWRAGGAVVPSAMLRQAGHFAGDRPERIDALVEVANDPKLDAVWLARGGYGACRVLSMRSPSCMTGPPGRNGLAIPTRASCWRPLQGGLQKCRPRADAGRPRSATMASVAVLRGLAWLVDGASGSLERGVTPGHPNLAFNLTILSQLLGTPLEPKLRRGMC